MATRTRFFFYPTPTQNLKNEQKASQESIRKIQFLPALLHQNSRILCTGGTHEHVWDVEGAAGPGVAGEGLGVEV